MVKGNAHEILQASLNRLQKEGLYKEVLGFLSERCNFDVYNVNNLTDYEATDLTKKIRIHKGNVNKSNRNKRKVFVIDLDDSEDESLPSKRQKCSELEKINEACKVCMNDLVEIDQFIAKIGK